MRVMVMVKATNCGRWREAWARHPVQGTILFTNCAGPELCGSQRPSLDLVGVRGFDPAFSTPPNGCVRPSPRELCAVSTMSLRLRESRL